MDPARWQRLNDLFHAAVLHAAGDRHAWLEGACGGDRVLLDEVARLVRAHEQADGTHTPASPAPEFTGTDRFSARRLLGAGGMGVVYEVHDRTRDEIVALKTLLRATATDVYRLKREFRSLADVAHPNLVSLYELFVEGEQCFFTMELVNGVSFVDYVRGDTGPSLLARLGVVFPQLVHGVSYLHRRGKLHRDIKPSNVLVTREGRVVILDFGLIVDLRPREGSGEWLAGTPAYMAPEQALGLGASEAGDWYSVGATLYEALEGLEDVPEEWSSICVDLLRADPAQRLSGTDALLRLERGSVASNTSATAAPRVREAPFVGRERPLAVLNDAFATVRQGRAAAVYVSGPSGIGKSALVRRFLDQGLARENVVVLSGRCYEHESVPYKALDGVVDSLSQYLASLPPAKAEGLMPRDVPALAQLFPVMMRVDAIAAAPRRDGERPDPPILRRRAFTALRELLARIADRSPVVVFIDDLHWADADSAVLLEELLRPPGAPAVLMVACFRSEEAQVKPFLPTPLARAGVDMAVPLSLGPMTDEEARALIESVIPADSPASRDDCLEITREARGNPFFLEELARDLAMTHVGPARRCPE